MSNKVERKQISRFTWRIMLWTFIVVGAIIYSVFSSTFYIPTQYIRASQYASIGGIFIGIGLGFMFSRVFKINGIDN